MQVSSVVVPRLFRFRFCDIRVARWLVPLLRCSTFPLAVILKRFFVPLCVFIFERAFAFVISLFPVNPLSATYKFQSRIQEYIGRRQSTKGRKIDKQPHNRASFPSRTPHPINECAVTATREDRQASTECALCASVF